MADCIAGLMPSQYMTTLAVGISVLPVPIVWISEVSVLQEAFLIRHPEWPPSETSGYIQTPHAAGLCQPAHQNTPESQITQYLHSLQRIDLRMQIALTFDPDAGSGNPSGSLPFSSSASVTSVRSPRCRNVVLISPIRWSI